MCYGWEESLFFLPLKTLPSAGMFLVCWFTQVGCMNVLLQHLTKRRACLAIKLAVHVYQITSPNNLFCPLVYLLISATFAFLSYCACFVSLKMAGFLVTGWIQNPSLCLDLWCYFNTNAWFVLPSHLPACTCSDLWLALGQLYFTPGAPDGMDTGICTPVARGSGVWGVGQNRIKGFCLHV